MAPLHAFVEPFLSTGVRSGVFTEITKDITQGGLGTLRQSLDNTEYDVGVFRNAKVKLNLRNDHGRYSDVDVIESVFDFKRSDSIIKVTWEPGDGIFSGFFNAGEPMAISSEEVEIYKGLLNDDSTKQDIKKQDIDFNVLGFESLFDNVDVPFASISNGDLFSVVMFTILNQSEITELLTVTQANIVVGNDIAIDDKTSLENKTIKEALKLLLLHSNSILKIENDTVIVSDREPTPDLKFTFFGQAAEDGIENILDINADRSGLNRMFNFWTWKDTGLVATNSTSATKFGIVKKEIDFATITNTAKRQNILNALRDEFGNPQRELLLTTPMTDTVIKLNLLDRVNINYPTISIASSEGILPLYGIAQYGVDVYPESVFNLTIDPLDNFKIMGKRFNLKQETLQFQLRKI